MVRHAWWAVALTIGLGLSAPAAAQTSVQPYFLIIVDTSGSMTGTTGGGTNSCGQAQNRMSDAKCVIQNVVNGYGEINFGLERFSNSCSGTCSASCSSTCGCACTQTCDATAASGEMLVPITAGNQLDILRWNDYSCATCGTTITANPELSAAGNTPLAGSLRAARQYYQGGHPTFPSPIATDPFNGCRPYAVILLTDGAETCGGTPATAATELRSTTVGASTYDINTYVIGFGIPPGNAAIEGIATAGGTDAPGPFQGFYATDETSLALAFSQIIADNILFETCNGADDDCDMAIDEGFTLYCDRPGGTPPPPTLCVDPGETVCDGIDDNCDGAIDEGLTNACGTCGPAPAEVCDAVDNDCDSVIDEGVCGMCTPVAEICDNVDNDCDMAVDESLTRPCGTNTGVCTTGVETCSMGAWGTCSGTGPSPEICDNLDNDCDGTVDGITRPCGSSVGRCSPGTQTCSMGSFGACSGAVGPIAETCNSVDDDCDGSTDEGNPGGGGTCGTSTGECSLGTVTCTGGALVCTGGVSPSPETCDLLDNDCDGSTDEAVPTMGPCGSSVGACSPGALTCTGGAFTCVGATGPSAETCNGVDDDCDGATDEGNPGGGGACGSSTGACVPGTLTCMGGALACTGGVSPSPETCNGVDDDCDGTVDDGVPTMGACGPSTGECSPGVNTCVMGSFTCVGATGPAPEACDARDNDCDGSTDEGNPGGGASCGSSTGACTPGSLQCMGGALVCAGGVSPGPETCNGVDDDCDGTVDDGVPTMGACGPSTGECSPGVNTCVSGSFMCVGATGPATEVCDGLDNDCDSSTDEGNPGGGAACGSSIGACSPGSLMCMGGTLVCTGGVSPSPETCNGADDDCDGAVDDGVPTMGPCGSSVGECSQGVNRCVSGAYACVGDRGPQPEVCDSRDNDCDMSTDEGNPGGGVVCGSSTGECMTGLTQCSAGTLTCAGGTGPAPEACDVLDNDCDGLVDEGNPGGGAACGMTNVGLCEFGALSCVMGALTCIGETGPSPEICDGADNDCDGMTDEGNPEGGGACGDDTGECMSGTLACVMGSLTCQGAVGPSPEVCDNLDNDCDGVIDDGIPVGAPCGSSVGECVPGVNVCRMGAIVCDGEIAPESEVCDLLDNDCDGSIDEGLGLGGPCGSSEGLCMPGNERCVNGRLVCEGEVRPTREGCDCDDNDCDGAVDEMPMMGELCPPGSSCVDCQCALPCEATEFGFRCPTGRAARVEGGECFCVAERCDAADCATQTVTQDGETACEPDNPDLANCVCRNNECTFSCDGVVCMDGTVCDPRDPAGRCVVNDCNGLGCPAGELCDTMSGECEADPCEGVMCPDGQACRGGDCEGSCAGVSCDDGEVCRAGVCTADACAGVSCMASEVCDPTSGECVDDLCAEVSCPPGQICELSSGDCVTDPCNELRCPEGEMCEAGECVEGVRPGEDAGPPAGFDAGTPTDEEDRVLASGGCNCRVGPASGPRPSAGWLLGLLLLGAVWSRRRRRSRRGGARGRALAVAALLVLSAGCDVDPFCLTCAEDEADGGDDGGMDASAGDAGDGVDSGDELDGGEGGVDASMEEVCNELDDDGDGMVDEDFDLDTDTDNCGACGSVCSPLGAFPICDEGDCLIDRCDVGRLDVNMDPSDGCEYRCLIESPDDAVCDRRDNDCDTLVDEDVDTTTDPANCGACGFVCSLPHATATCGMGNCLLDACDADWFDIDADPMNGCEYNCTLASPPTEVCNLIDDDCDGTLDEGNPGGGGSCGSSVGACVQGTEQCVGGSVTCVGETAPTTELCNGVDDDCDSSTDEGNPEGGRLCGVATGTCTQGREQCTSGALACTGEVGPSPEACDGLDNDCDSTIDEGNPGGGGTCGSSVGACVAGTQACRAGAIVCEGATTAVPETCNAADDDCDGSTDEGNPEGGGSCGSDVGACGTGTLTCSAGALSCVGDVGPSPEICDTLDNDCDGTVDEGNPGGGASCGSGVGTCVAGTETCVAGAVVCVGDTGPSPEACDTLDNDCDGSTDEGNPGGGGGCGSDVGQCTFGTRTCSGGSIVCVGGTGPSPELCDSLDNDCDLSVDEGNPGGGAACGSATGACTQGTEQCVGGAVSCIGGTGPTVESCNGLDDDCDASIDEGNPGGGGNCGTNQGQCTFGTNTCSGGSIVCVGGTGPSAELCDSLDNDCDTSVDEGNPGGGAACGSSTGACTQGSELCVGGALVCTGGTGPSPESCNNVDDDCDSSVDEGNPGGGGTCGTDVGSCTFGTRSCVAGALQCVGGMGPSLEACNALDDDCDSSIDEGNPGGGASCGSGTGLCTPGSQTCLGGTLQCSGGTGPAPESCDTFDNDCDGATDEGFDLTSDPNNCGGCGNVCPPLANASTGCVSSSCSLLACAPGFVDLNMVQADGCEYACSFNGAEICNGVDDDCDGVIDDGLTPPPLFCNPNGVCAGTTPTCAAGAGWQCNYPATFETTETRCDGLDNDCDGATDEPFPNVGAPCNNGELGECRIDGAFVCNGTQDGTVCDAPASGGGSAESCNDLDDDCDGTTDEGAPDAWVPFTAGGLGQRFIYAYEASRPDATASDQGSATHRSCSAPGRLPWTNVTHAQAEAACAAVGARLCTETEWQEACESTTNTCDWSHELMCTTYQPAVCNGDDFDTDPGMAGDQDGAIPTGSRAQCLASWGGVGAQVFDMSGNIEEWTAARQAGVNPLRGGANNDISGGMRCDFDFVVAGDTISLPTVGFRCCRDTPLHCSDAALSGDESDVDCGGSCLGCVAGQSCGGASDCASGVCSGGVCQAPSCSDSIQNGGETDVDCGGATACPRCANGLSCTAGTDCVGTSCVAGTCDTCGPDNFRINEIFGDTPDYIEIVNAGSCNLNINTLDLRFRLDCDGAPLTFAFPSAMVGPGGTYRVIDQTATMGGNEVYFGANICHNPAGEGWVALCSGACNATCSNYVDYAEVRGATLPVSPPSCATFTPAPFDMTGAGAATSATRAAFAGSGNAGVRSDYIQAGVSRTP